MCVQLSIGFTDSRNSTMLSTLVPCSVGIFVRCLSHCTPPTRIHHYTSLASTIFFRRTSFQREAHREQGDQNGGHKPEKYDAKWTYQQMPRTTCKRSVAPRRPGSLGFPSLHTPGSLGPPPFCVTDATPRCFSGVPLSVAAVVWQLGRFLFRLSAREF